MATAAMYRQPIFNRSKGEVMVTTKNNLNEIVRKIRALKKLQEVSGFSTNRSIIEMLSRLPEPDLIAIGEALLSETK